MFVVSSRHTCAEYTSTMLNSVRSEPVEERTVSVRCRPSTRPGRSAHHDCHSERSRRVRLHRFTLIRQQIPLPDAGLQSHQRFEVSFPPG